MTISPFYRTTIGGKEYKLKLTTAAKIEAEKKLGFPLLEAIGKIDYAETFAVVLWASLQKFHTFTFEEALRLCDTFEDEGNTIEEKVDIVLGVFKVSGFFTKQALKEMEQAEAKSKAKEASKEQPTTARRNG